MAKVKGSTFSPRMNYAEKKGGPEAKAKVLAALSPALQNEFRQGIMVGQWYPFDYYVELNRVIDQVLGKGDLALVRELGRFSADEGLKGIYKFFYKIGSVEFIIKRATQVWRQYFDNGQVLLTVEAPGRARMIFQNVEVSAHEHCLSVMGWVERTVELSGGRDVKVTIDRCRDRGDAQCEFIILWKE